MSGNIKPHERGPQLLRILGSHGPLSIRGLSAIVSPPIARRKLRESLKRLEAKKYVTRLNDKVFGGSGIFYRLNNDRLILKEITSELGLPENEFDMLGIRHPELLHTESCAVLAHRLQQQFPKALVIRDLYFSRYPEIQNILLASEDEYEKRPDILIFCKTSDGLKEIVVAVEIERTQKSEKRLYEKLKKYAVGTTLDGVIYFCLDDSIANTLRQIYQSQVLKQALRVNQYGDNFLLLGHNSSAQFHTLHDVTNSAGKNVAVDMWITHLCSTSIHDRRDVSFNCPAPEGRTIPA